MSSSISTNWTFVLISLMGGIVNPNLYDFTLFLPQKKHLLPFIELKHAKLLFKLLKLSINFSI
ncbi:hypothetical protein DZA51_03345 [Vibrio campbellii]|nr:hypothetical protein DZA51_03345 [Vibrio campbellii]